MPDGNNNVELVPDIETDAVDLGDFGSESFILTDVHVVVEELIANLAIAEIDEGVRSAIAKIHKSMKSATKLGNPSYYLLECYVRDLNP